jgi:hypothetical protein
VWRLLEENIMSSRLNESMSSRVRALTVRLALGVAAAGLVGAVSEGTASAQEVVVRTGPPAARHEVVPRAPSSHHVWAPGYWGYERDHHVWYGGRYIEGRPGHTYVPAHWTERGGYWHLSNGYWR